MHATLDDRMFDAKEFGDPGLHERRLLWMNPFDFVAFRAVPCAVSPLCVPAKSKPIWPGNAHESGQ
jgi:hypothetical protein